MNKHCIDCGTKYEYDPNNSRGCSSTRCKTCQKRSAAFNKKLILISIASNDKCACRLCGYSKSKHALALMDTFAPLQKLDSFEWKKEFAKRQFVLCLNCKARVDSGEIEIKVNSSKHPVDVSFLEPNVTIVKQYRDITPAEQNDALVAEIVSDVPSDMKEAKKIHKLQ